jgi:rSAM/selenodomain-associated transferase 1
MRRTLGLFAKAPRPGLVKSRLAAQTNPTWAAQVADAFLRDLVKRLAAIEARRVLVMHPPEEGPYFSNLAQGRFAMVPQTEGDLGRRMAEFIADELGSGAEQVILLGSDSPTVPLAYLNQAFVALEKSDVVLGPATDGGYYLIGCARRLPPLFDGISWGGPRVLMDTVACLQDATWKLALLPPWYDLDTLEGWLAMRGHIAALRRAGIDPEIPFTEALAALGEPEGVSPRSGG